MSVLLATALITLTAVTAEAGTWEKASTRHFLFIFEPRDRAYVDELLGFAEDVYAKVTGFFDSYPPVVPCVIRGRIDDANGLTMSFPSRIDLYLTAPTDQFLGARSESWLRLLLTHELTHFVHQSMSTGLLHELSLLFGSELSTLGLDLLPGWAVEGPAVYDETVFSQGGRGRNPLFELYTKAAVQEGTLFSYDQAAYLSPFPPPGRIYVAGYALVDWLETKYGPGTFRGIMKEYLAFPFLGPRAAIRKVTGREPSAVFAQMRKAMIARYAPFLVVPGGSLVTPERTGDWSHPQPTARGLYVYHTAPEAFPAIVRWDAAAQAETVLVKASLTDAASFSATADGASVWFSTVVVDDSRPAEQRSVSDLWLLDTASGHVRQITRGAHLWHPAVSADGSRILAVQGSGPYTRLVSVDPTTGSVRVLFSRIGGNVENPVLSFDGRTVAFVLNLRGFQDVYVAALASLDAGSSPVDNPRDPVVDVNHDLPRAVLGPDPFGEYFPSFQNDGTLLFSSDRSGSMALYSADLGTGAAALVQRDPVAAVAGVVDGDMLLYTSYSSNGYCIRSTPLDALAPEPLEQATDVGPPAETLPSNGASVPSRPYTDLPAPYLWLPHLVLTPTGPSSLDLAFGLGAQVLGGSLLGATQWNVDAAWLIGVDQPVAGIDLSTSFGQVGIEAASRLSYSWAGFLAEEIRSSAGLRWTVFDQTVRDVSRSFVVSVGLRHTAQRSFGAPPDAWFSYVGVPASVTYDGSTHGGRIDFNPPWAVSARLSGIVYLPVLSLAAAQGEADLFLSVNIPAFSHGVIKLGLKAAQDFGGSFVEYLDDFTLPRGFIGPRIRPVPGGLLAAADYLVPLALLDMPLLLGWGLTGAGLGMHIEAIADFDAAAGIFAPVPFVFAGADLTLRLSFSSLSLPVGIGVGAAISTAAPGSFDPARDLGIYLFVGFDSFADAARRAATATPVQGREAQ